MDTLLNATPSPFLYEYAERRRSVTSTSVMNSRRLTSIKLHSLPASQATELQDIKLATNRSAGIGATVQPVSRWRGRPMSVQWSDRVIRRCRLNVGSARRL